MSGDNSKPLKILLVAVEPSGDGLGAALYKELKRQTPVGTTFYGCGGKQMQEAGFESSFPIETFSVIGLTGFLKAIPEGVKRAKQIGEIARDNAVDVAIYIDGWAFSWRAAKYTRKYSPKTKTIKYATPQVWASRPGRVSTVKQYFDSVLTLLPFEPRYFLEAGMEAEFVGNPNFQQVYKTQTDETATKTKYGLTADKILTVLPGSRKGEVLHLAECFSETIKRLAARIPDLQIAIPVAPSVQGIVEEQFKGIHGVKLIDAEDRFSVYKISTAALAASGTVSTELAIAGAPMVIGYKLDAITYWWARSVMTTEYVSILNVAADEEIIPEFIQGDCEVEQLEPALYELLTEGSARNRQKQAFSRLLDELAVNKAPAAEIAAEAILKQIVSS